MCDTTANRTPISKRKRFEIFKRDNFTCKYCGRKPPEVVLEIDHIVPVSAGGTSEKFNLTTSCFSCNRGKSSIELTTISTDIIPNLEKEKESYEQLKALNKFLTNKRKEIQKDVEEIGCYFFDKWEPGKNLIFAGGAEQSIKQFLSLLPKAEILNAIDIAYAKMNNRAWYQSFKYFCGICWRMINRKNGIEI